MQENEYVNPHAYAADYPPIGKFRPLGAWEYFGLQLLFAIPVIGFIFLIIFSLSDGNRNRRSFARSYFCGLVVVALLAVAGSALAMYLGVDQQAVTDIIAQLANG